MRYRDAVYQMGHVRHWQRRWKSGMPWLWEKPAQIRWWPYKEIDYGIWECPQSVQETDMITMYISGSGSTMIAQPRRKRQPVCLLKNKESVSILGCSCSACDLWRCAARYADGEILYCRQYDSAGCAGQGHWSALLLQNGEVKRNERGCQACRNQPRNILYKYKDYVFLPAQGMSERKAVISYAASWQRICQRYWTRCRASMLNILTINQNIPIHEWASVVLSFDLCEMAVSIDELLERLRSCRGCKQSASDCSRITWPECG